MLHNVHTKCTVISTKATKISAILIFISIVVLFINLLITVQSNASDTKRLFSVVTYQASPEGFRSNSHIIVFEKEAILIDAQFSLDEGRKVVDILNSTGKKLSKIIITHPHPDHYYGLEVLGVEFADAEITGGPLTMAEVRNTMKYWENPKSDTMEYKKLVTLEKEQFNHENVDFRYKIFRDGESIENTIIYIPSEKILFIGDLASNGVHMWIGENNIDNWLSQLKATRAIGSISIVYPGHGSVGSIEILEQSEEYLKNFKKSVTNSKSIDEAITKMKKLYPDYKMPEILEGSVRSVMWNKDKAE